MCPKHLNADWSRPKQLEIPNKLAEILLNAVEEYVEYLNKIFSDQLINNEEIAQSFYVMGEFLNLNNKLYIIVRAHK